MAIALEDTRVLEEELKCPVCLDLYREPHLLPCGHSFCLQCLQSLKSHSKLGQLHCPECRQSHRSSTQWQKNFKLASIADGFRQHKRSWRHRQRRPGPPYRTTEVCCDYCGPNNTGDSAKRSTAVNTCLKCEVSMCPEHVQQHLELPALREHPLVDPLSDIRKRKCIEHGEMFRYYCMDEHKFLCNACTIDVGHNRHVIKTLNNTMKDLQGSLGRKLQKVNGKIRRVEKHMQKQRGVDQQNKAYVEQVDRLVGTHRRVLITRLNGFLNMLSECARHFEGVNSRNIQKDLVRTEKDSSHLGAVRAGIEQLLLENDPFQFITAYKSCAKSYHRLLKRLSPPQAVKIHMELVEEYMTAKLEDFLNDLRDHMQAFINTVRKSNSVNEREEGVEEEEMEDVTDENDSSSDEDEEQEEEMSEEEEDFYHSESTDEEE